jgi:hypothetical protein
MAVAADVYWFYDPSTYIRRYGVQQLGGNAWAVVEEDHSTSKPVFKELTIVRDRQTAIGFINLLVEKRNEY